MKLEYVQGDGPSMISLEWKTPEANAGEAEALAKAKEADVIVFVGGISAQLEGEEMQVDYEGFSGGDRARIELPDLQQTLLKKLNEIGKPIVFVNLSGSAIALPWADKNLNAILQAWYPGQAGGTAVAEVLLGRTNPSGRLPITFYRATEDLPGFNDYRMAGRTYRYFQRQSAVPLRTRTQLFELQLCEAGGETKRRWSAGHHAGPDQHGCTRWRRACPGLRHTTSGLTAARASRLVRLQPSAPEGRRDENRGNCGASNRAAALERRTEQHCDPLRRLDHRCWSVVLGYSPDGHARTLVLSLSSSLIPPTQLPQKTQ